MGTDAIIILLIVGTIVIIQIMIANKTYKKIQNFKNVFSFAVNGKNIVEKSIPKIRKFETEDIFGNRYEHDITHEEKYLHLKTNNKNGVFSKIENEINQYLFKNIGAISDFNLLKDIVERHCETEREEINTQTPVPMYLGLMGTIIGIIIGLSAIFSNGEIKDLVSDTKVIASLLQGISIAMTASFVGITATTIISWISKEGNKKNEDEKNKFYSFLQAELIPRLYKDSISDLTILENNLSKFNDMFTKNINKFESSLSRISEISDSQTQVIELVNNLDIKNVSKANVEVLRQITINVEQFEKFNDYIIKTNDYVSSINKLNTTLNKQLTLQNSIEKMYDFFVNEINQIEQRKSEMINQVSNFDSVYNDTLISLKNNSQTNIEEFKKFVVEQISSMRENMNTTKILVDELKQLSETKKLLDNMNSLTKMQNSKIDKLINSIKNFTEDVVNIKTGGTVSSKNIFNRLSLLQKVLLYTSIGSVSLISIILIIQKAIDLYIYLFGNTHQ